MTDNAGTQRVNLSGVGTYSAPTLPSPKGERKLAKARCETLMRGPAALGP